MKTRAIIFSFLAGVIGLWAGWLLLINRYATGTLPIVLDRTPTIGEFGAFGDSFGAFSSLMAALAAAAAFIAYFRQQRDTSIQEFERNFFTMLNNLQLIVADIDVKYMASDDLEKAHDELDSGKLTKIEHFLIHAMSPTNAEIKGREALRGLLAILRVKIKDSSKFKDSKTIARIYEQFYNQWHDDLGHYFRTCYHIYRMIDEVCPGNKQKYARMIRAHLSNSELILIAYNCSVGIGRFKFKKLTEKYSVFHNYHLQLSDKFFKDEESFFERMFDEKAFRKDEREAFAY